MNTFFRICVYYCLGLMVFSLLFGLINATGAFGISLDPGGSISDSGGVLGEVSTLETPSMGFLLGLVAFGGAAGLFVSWISKSIVPVGISIFGSVFWASFINLHSVLSIGGGSGPFIPAEILLIITVCTILIFIAAIIGMLTGSG